jgi:BNR/Asp-box repeat
VLALLQPARRAADPEPTPPPGPAFEVESVVFTDRQTGYVVVGPCAVSTSGCATAHGLARTGDGGRTWQRVELPLPDPGPDQYIQLAARQGGGLALSTADASYVSHDGGDTWRRVRWLRPGPPVDAVPEGHELLAFCSSTTAPCTGMSAMDPVEGTVRRLAHQPAVPRGGQLTAWAATERGPFVWAAAVDQRGALRLLYSDDRGRRWHLRDGPAGGWFRPEILPVPSASRVYLVDHAQSGQVGGVWRLDDPDGGAWTDVGRGRLEGARSVQVLPDGELRYTDVAGQAWQTRDGGTRLERAALARVDGADIDVRVVGHVDGMLVGLPVVGRRGDRVLFSTDDGAHWQVRPVRF